MSHLPEILIVQMKRFKYDEKVNQIKKLDCHVSFGQLLSLKVHESITKRIVTTMRIYTESNR